jgi:excisionase family DNA binding protein
MISEGEVTKSADTERTRVAKPIKAKEAAARLKRTQEDDAQAAGRLLTLTEAAFRLGRVHRTTIMRWVKEGKLKCVRLSRKAILFEPNEIDRFIREHRYSG